MHEQELYDQILRATKQRGRAVGSKLKKAVAEQRELRAEARQRFEESVGLRFSPNGRYHFRYMVEKGYNPDTRIGWPRTPCWDHPEWLRILGRRGPQADAVLLHPYSHATFEDAAAYYPSECGLAVYELVWSWYYPGSTSAILLTRQRVPQIDSP